MKYINQQMLAADTTSENASSSAIDGSQIYRCSVQAVVTGSASAGSVKLQGSNDMPSDGSGNYGPSPMNIFVPSNWTDIASAAATVSGANTYLIPVTEISHQYLRVTYTTTAALVQTVTAVADVSGSLNDTYFLLNSTTAGYYVWFNVSSGGTDPMVAGRTGIQVDIMTNDSAADVAAAMETAIDAVAGVFASTATMAALEITNSVAGSAVLASDSDAAPTGFSFSSNFGSITTRLKSVNA